MHYPSQIRSPPIAGASVTIEHSVLSASRTETDRRVPRSCRISDTSILHDDMSLQHAEGDSPFRAGYVALVGRANVGKSTLLNALLGHKLTAVTRKPQTTRFLVRGILTNPRSQMILEDTPGILDPRQAIDKAMLRLAQSAARNADVVLLLVSPWRNMVEQELSTASKIPGKAPVLVGINKIDLVRKVELLPLIADLIKGTRIKEAIPISAKHHDGLDLLTERIEACLPPSSPLYPPDQLTDQPERFFAAEILREQILQRYRQEVPYATAVQIEEFKERSSGKDLIRAVVWVERESQKRILIGKHGSALKRLGIAARRELELFLGREVYLELWVKIRPGWRDREADLSQLGFGRS